jgi:H/ACA ribonucleoprotein complex subunit 3
MRFQIRKCPMCMRYTLMQKCQKCDEPTILVHPAKFSPDDKYLKLRMLNKPN